MSFMSSLVPLSKTRGFEIEPCPETVTHTNFCVIPVSYKDISSPTFSHRHRTSPRCSYDPATCNHGYRPNIYSLPRDDHFRCQADLQNGGQNYNVDTMKTQKTDFLKDDWATLSTFWYKSLFSFEALLFQSTYNFVK